MNSIEQAKQLYNKGFPIVPCIYRKKHNLDSDIETRDYKLETFNDQNNIAVQLQKAGWVAFDPENEWSIKFANKFLGSLNTLKTIRIHKDNRYTVGYFFKNDLGLTEDVKLDDSIMEIRQGGIHILVGETELKPKGSKVYVKREISNNVDPIPLTEEILNIGKKIAFMAALAPHIKDRFNNDEVALRIDGCLCRYTNSSDEERTQFLKDFYSIVKSDYKNLNENDFNRKIRGNNKGENVAGYKALSEVFPGVLKYTVKQWCNWIGTVPEKEKDIKKRIISFKSNSLTEDQLKKKVERKDLIEGLYPDHGLVIKAGRPKSMKSFCALDLAYSVQNKSIETFYGKKIISHGDVLGLFLEDDSDTMASRIQGMNFIDLEKPTTFVEDCPRITQGLEESIEMWCDEVLNPKLVIIDTFQKIKPLYTKGGQNANAYEIDYHYLSILKRLADKNKLLIMYVHHLKQAKVDYKWDRIMGSTGHQGVTDAMYMIDREELGSSATFMGRGRNLKDFQYQLIWNDEKLRYENTMAAPTIIVTNETKRQVFKAMKTLVQKYNKQSVKPSEVYEVLGLDAKSLEAKNIQKTMQRMRSPGNDQELKLGSGFGTYSLKVPPEHIDEEGNISKEFANIV